MSYDQWAKEHNSNGELLKECWQQAQAEMLHKVEKQLGDNYGFANGRFYPKLSDVLKQIT